MSILITIARNSIPNFDSFSFFFHFLNDRTSFKSKPLLISELSLRMEDVHYEKNWKRLASTYLPVEGRQPTLPS